MTRKETIVELARTLHLARDVDTIAAGHGGTGNESRLLQLSNLYHDGSYRPIEDALALMRNQAKQQARGGHSLGTLRWHFCARYLEPTRKRYEARTRGHRLEILYDGQWQLAHGEHRAPVGSPTSDTRGKRVLVVESWHPDVRLERVDLALDWLAATIQPCTCHGQPPHRLHLPGDWDTERKPKRTPAVAA